MSIFNMVYGKKNVIPFKPGANTLLYMPMTEDFNDHSQNSYTISNPGATITTLNGVKCGYFNNNKISTNVPAQNKYNMTYSVWVYTTSNSNQWIIGGNPASVFSGEYFIIWGTSSVGWGGIVNSSYYNGFAASGNVCDGQWHHLCYSNKKLYIDGILGGTLSYSGDTYTPGYSYFIGAQNGGANPYYGYMSELIVEDGEWDATTILNYYNKTKSNYGL